MIRLLELLISLVIVAALFVLVGLMLPADRVVQHSIETNYPSRMIYDLMNGFRRFPEWFPLRSHDPAVQFSLEGEPRGAGAKIYFASTSPNVGNGSFEIVDSIDLERIEYHIENESRGENKRSVVEIEDQGKTRKVTWTYTVDYGWDLFGRYAGLYVNRTAGDDIKAALGHVGGLLATMPRFDYSDIEVAYEGAAPQHMLFVELKTKRNITAVEEGMIKAINAIRSALRANNLESAGPVRLITTNFGSDEYEFDVAIPFLAPENAKFIDAEDYLAREQAAADAAAAAAAAAAAEAAGEEVAPVETEEPMSAEDQAAADALALLLPQEAKPALPFIDGLLLPENVKQGVTYSGRVVTTTYSGHPAALPLLRDQLRAYAATHGDVVQDRAYEEYLNEIEETAAEDSEFRIFWPIR